MRRERVIIIGAAGRDFHNFNVYYRNNPDFEVVAFTAAQIPDISGRIYPPELTGILYPAGIPVFNQDDLPALIKELNADTCLFSYSDVSYQYVMSLGSIINAAGADFLLLGPKQTMLPSSKPVIAVCATRTGCGKSPVSRKIVEILMGKGLRVIVIRHPMPYGNLAIQKVQRFASLNDLSIHNCTIEEMEEYEPHIVSGNVIYAGVDYEAILRAAEKDPDGCDLILWDGGNNDFPFYKPDLYITVADPHRAGAELNYYPGELNVRMADVIIINKVDSALPEQIQKVRENVKKLNSVAKIIESASPVRVDHPELITGKRVLCIEDGPTLTHGEMKFGAAVVAARNFGASEIIDPRPYAVGKLKATFEKYPGIGVSLPAMGYGQDQVSDLEETIHATDCDTVIIGTPINLNRIINIGRPNTRVYYEIKETSNLTLNDIMAEFLSSNGIFPEANK